MFQKSIILLALTLHSISGFGLQSFSSISRSSTNGHGRKRSPQIQTSSGISSSLKMGLLDKISKAFLQERDGDFVKLQDSDDAAESLGPAILLYNIPAGILDEELEDMLEDGAPKSSKKGVTLQRIPDMNDPLLELTLEEALVRVLDDKDDSDRDESSSSSDNSSLVAPIEAVNRGTPVMIFSGFPNAEMMASYNIIAEEIFRENGGRAACAKAVPNALPKPLRQVVEEISGDHQNALAM
ncbi:unnamed protein product [Cylindrotheca closterium]|uniref:Uncharacterized protein n=1 Tax=Cylindrotheca closterium TaxID=2856 RepID=A0AAD2CR70_9STRA|nr:unnamed protein product [Cylindrotheca closterium]